MSDPLLSIRNHHAPYCGDPPIVDECSGDVYIGYFANSQGEQWIFTRNRVTGEATLRGGDIAWNTVHNVIDGQVPGLMLNAEEQLWLQACRLAVAAGA